MLAAATLALALVQAQVDDPRAKTAFGVTFVFSQVCLLRLNVKQTPAAYAAGSEEVGRSVIADNPALKGVLAIDGADGRGCRVAYTGGQADVAWTAANAAFASLTRGPAASCTAGGASADRLSATCVSTAPADNPGLETRRADLTVARSGVGAQESVTAMLTNLRP